MYLCPRPLPAANGSVRSLRAGLALLLTLAALASCRSATPAAADTANLMPPVQALLQQGELGPTEGLRVTRATLEGTVLTLEIDCPEACADTRLELVHSGMLMKSMPPQAPLWLHRPAGQGSCAGTRALTRRYELASLQAGGTELVIRLRGYGERVVLPARAPGTKGG